MSDEIGPLNSFLISTLTSVILLLGWLGVVNKAGALTFCAFYGFFSSGIITLPATVVATTLCRDMTKFGTMMVLQCAFGGAGLLVGNPIAGALLPRGWHALEGWSIACTGSCFLIAAGARVALRGWSIRGRC